jgi:hypothetical protein
MQFKVPQFIDVEDKLFGPFTFAQFAYLIGGAGAAFVAYKLLPLWISIFLIIPIVGISILLVFVKINNKPFIYYLQAGMNYLISSKLYIWKQRTIDPNNKENEDENTPSLVSVVPMTSANKIKDLSWSLDMEEKEKEIKE